MAPAAGLFGSKGKDIMDSFTKSPGVSTVADPYGGIREPYLNYMQGQIGKSGPVYGGEVTAPMTAQETQSLDKVNQYANQGSNSTLDAGKAQIEKTLNGSYDPSTSPYYQAVKAQSAANLADTNKQIASDAAGAGRYFAGSRIKQQGRAANESGMNLDTIMGTLTQNERQNQLAVLPQALAYGQQEQNLPLEQAKALQTVGSLPRQLQQNTDTESLNNFYKSQYDYPLSILQMIAGIQAPPVYQQNPDRIGQITELAAKAAGAAAMGCWVAAEVFNGMQEPKTVATRYWLNYMAPVWFRDFYMSHGPSFAAFIHRRPLMRIALRPLFELFSYFGNRAMSAGKVCA